MMTKPRISQLLLLLLFLSTASIRAQSTGLELPLQYRENITMAVTVDPLQVFAGEIPVSLQYSPWDWLVLEAGVGITWRPFWHDLLDDHFILGTTSEKSRINPSFHSMIKMFPDAYTFDDSYYLGMMFRYKKYSNLVTGTSGSTPVELVESRRYKDIGVVYGYHRTTGITNLFLDYYIGPAIRYVSEKEVYESSSGLLLEPDKRISFTLLLGLKIGYVFY